MTKPKTPSRRIDAPKRHDISRGLTIKPQTRSSARAHERTDRWVNERNRFGGRGDPVSRTTFFRDVSMTRDLLESLYRYDWLTRRAVEIPAQDATREWVTLKHDNPKKIQLAERELRRIKLQAKFEELIILARLYGGAVMVLGAFDGNEVQLPLGDVKKPMFFVKPVDRFLAYPLTFYKDPLDPKYGEPELYQVTNPTVQGSEVMVVHESRLVRMDGNYLPPLERIRNFTYGASVIESILEATRQFGICSQGLAGVVQDFVVKKLKVENLQDLLQSEDGQDILNARLGEMASAMSMFGIATFGSDEEFDKMGTPITGLPDIADRFVEYASAATGIPRSRLFNNLSGRLGGDSGENDLRVHYDTIRAFQKNRLHDLLQYAIDVALQPLGIEPGEMQFEFHPLWQPSEKERAETRLAVAQADKLYVEMGAVEPEEVAMSRFSGDGINLDDMQIETKPREAFLKELAKQSETPQREAINNPPEPAVPPVEGGPDDDPDKKPQKGNGTDPSARTEH